MAPTTDRVPSSHAFVVYGGETNGPCRVRVRDGEVAYNRAHVDAGEDSHLQLERGRDLLDLRPLLVSLHVFLL